MKENTILEVKTAKQVPNKNKNASKDSKKTLLVQQNSEVKIGKKVINQKPSVVPQSETVTKVQLNKQKTSNEKKNLKKSNKKPVAEVKSQKIVIKPTLDKAQKRKAAIKAFNTNQKMKRAAECDEKINKQTSSSKTEFEPVPFDEEKFKAILNLKNIKKIGEALKALVEKEVIEKKTSIFSDYRYFLNICSYKISNCPRRMVKLNLEHPLISTSTDDVVIIVPDIQRGAKVDYEPTIQHYEDLFREIGVSNLKIVPFNQLRKECTTFESKRKFANTYDYFLCDGRIVSHVVGFCGKHFQKPRTTIHAVRMDNPKTYKRDIEHALKRTAFKQLQKGDLVSIPVGNHRFTVDQLADNILLVVEQLKSLHPGGYANIRNMNIKIDIKGTSSLPLYVNLAGAPSETPNVIGTREQRMLKLKKEANDILSKFSMSKTGEFIKLNKTQVQRKQKLRETRVALLSEESTEASNDAPPCKKIRKDNKELEKQVIKKTVELGDEKDESEENEDNEEEENDNNEDDSSDNAEEDDDSVEDSE